MKHFPDVVKNALSNLAKNFLGTTRVGSIKLEVVLPKFKACFQRQKEIDPETT